MSAFSLELSTLLERMRDKAKADEVDLKYLRECEVVPEWGYVPNEPAVFLIPDGSEEEEVSEGPVLLITHRVWVVPVVHTERADVSSLVLGGGGQVGIVPFVSDVMSFFGANLLGFGAGEGLLRQRPPRIKCPAGSYEFMEEESGNARVASARLLYEAWTKPHTR